MANNTGIEGSERRALRWLLHPRRKLDGMGFTGIRDIQRAVALMEEATSGLVVEEVPVLMADRLVVMLARCEHQVTALRVELARRVTEAGVHEASGGRDAAGYLAGAMGTSRGRARAELELAERVAKTPEVARALRDGTISPDQARVIAPAAEADPRAVAELLGAAESESFSELRQRAARKERAARGEESQEESERRLHERRYCRTSSPKEGGVRVDAWLSAVEGARFLAALDKRTGELLRGSDELPDQLRADALVELCCGQGARTEVCVRVDAAALVRGAVDGDEVCEVDGVGPISVKAARSLLGDAFLTLLVGDGVDVSTVTSTTRFIPRRIRKALEERDRCCVVPGCGARYHLQIDHWRVDFEKTGPTELDNLCRLCSVHHRQKTNGVITLDGGPGRWIVRPGRMAGRRAGEPVRLGGPARGSPARAGP